MVLADAMDYSKRFSWKLFRVCFLEYLGQESVVICLQKPEPVRIMPVPLEAVCIEWSLIPKRQRHFVLQRLSPSGRVYGLRICVRVEKIHTYTFGFWNIRPQ